MSFMTRFKSMKTIVITNSTNEGQHNWKSCPPCCTGGCMERLNKSMKKIWGCKEEYKSEEYQRDMKDLDYSEPCR